MPATPDPVMLLAAAAVVALGAALVMSVVVRLRALAHAAVAIGAGLLGVAGVARLIGGTDLLLNLGDFRAIAPRIRIDALAALLWVMIAALAIPAILHAHGDRRSRSPASLALLVLAAAATNAFADAHSITTAWAATVIAIAFLPREGSEPETPNPFVLSHGLIAIVALALSMTALSLDDAGPAGSAEGPPHASMICLFVGAVMALASIAPFHRSRLDAATRATGPALALMTGLVPAAAVALMLRGTVSWLFASPWWIVWTLSAWLMTATLHTLATALIESRLPRAMTALIGANFGAVLLTLALAGALGQHRAGAPAAEVLATTLVQSVVVALLAGAAMLATSSIVARYGDEMHLHGGVLRRMPAVAFALLAALAGLASLPPLAGFLPMAAAIRVAALPLASTAAPHPLAAVIAVALALIWAGCIAVALRIAITTLVGAGRADHGERIRDSARGQRAAVVIAAGLSLLPVIAAVPLTRIAAEISQDLYGRNPKGFVAAAEASLGGALTTLLLVAVGVALCTRKSREVATAWSGGLSAAAGGNGAPSVVTQPFTAALPEILEARYESELTPGPSDYAPAEIRMTVRFQSMVGLRATAIFNLLRSAVRPILEREVTREAQLALWIVAAIALALAP